MITLNNIAKLIANMKTCQLYRQKFAFKYNKRTVEVMLFIDEIPFQLLIGVYNTNCSLFFNISPIGMIDDFIRITSDYNKLKLALGINSDNPGKFIPSEFFRCVDAHSPITAKTSALVKPQDRFRYDRNIEEASKIYFIGYRDNTKYGGHVTKQSYGKTCKAFGKNEANFLKSKNISTRWTDNAKDAIDFFHLNDQ